MGLPQREASFAERLRAQGHALQARGFELCREGEQLKAEALELFNDADALERAPVRVGVGRGVRVVPSFLTDLKAVPTPSERVPEGEPSKALVERVETLLAVGGWTVAQLADHVGTSKLRVKAILGRLEEEGKAYRQGKTRGTRWFLVEPEPVRTGQATLHVFTKTTPRRELEDRRVAWTTEAPAEVGVLPERDDS